MMETAKVELYDGDIIDVTVVRYPVMDNLGVSLESIMITTTEIERNRKAWELVQRIAESIPKSANACPYCHCDFYYDYHSDDCIWILAKQLTEDSDGT